MKAVVQFDGLTEHRGPIELAIKGNIPAWAAGSLYRTGPSQSKVEDTKSGTFHFSHWFDGLAHTHRFDIVTDDDNDAAGEPTVRMYYSSRRQAEKMEADIKATGTLRSMTFAQKLDPCVGVFGKFMAVFNKQPRVHNVGVTVNVSLPSFKPPPKPTVDSQGHRAASIVLGTDAAVMCEVDPKTMEPIGFPKQTKFHPDLKGPLSAAHGKIDPDTGDYINYNLAFGKQTVYRIFRVSAATGKTDILATIPSKAAYIHSLFLTPDYVVLCIPVAHFQGNGAKIVWEGNLLDSFKPFSAAEPCRWFVVDRHHAKGVVAEFSSPARFFFHTVNAYEDASTGDLLCEVVDYPNRAIIDAFYYDVLLNRHDAATNFWRTTQEEQQCFPQLTRYRLAKTNFSTTAKPEATIDLQIRYPHAGDMPTINPLHRTRPHRFVYMLLNRSLSTLFDAIGKLDTHTGEVVLWEGGQGHTPGEAVFVPRPAAVQGGEEDDGVLLSVVLDGGRRTSYLVCLDARSMKEVGRAEAGFAVGFGLHGRHIAADGKL